VFADFPATAADSPAAALVLNQEAGKWRKEDHHVEDHC
jgi:hypothetical protein